MSNIGDALNYEKTYHRGQVRWDGTPYIEHPSAVAKKCGRYGEVVVITALLHDLIEDTLVTHSDIQKRFGDDVASAVGILTKDAGEEYFDYIMRLVKSRNPTALLVKEKDLEHNLSDIRAGSLKDKYRLASHIIETALTELEGEVP